MNPPLPHKLLEHRTQAGLTQDELAFLLGASSGARVSRYESFKRLPDLNMVMAYVAVHQRSMEELFEGKYMEVVAQVLERARVLHARLVQTSTDQRKIAIIHSLILVLEQGSESAYE